MYDATVARCFGGQAPSTANNTCTAVNSAPVCKSINRGRMYGGKWPLISTFALYANQGVQVGGWVGGNGRVGMGGWAGGASGWVGLERGSACGVAAR